jgi:hypothetical protein
MAPMEAPLWTPVAEKKQMYSINLTFSVYIHGSWNLGKAYDIKPRCYWEHFEECIWEHFENLRTNWNFDENTLRTHWEQGKNPSPPAPSKKEKIGPFVRACWAFLLAAWNFCFQNFSSPFFAKKFLFFEISYPMWPNRGFRCCLFLTLRITVLSHVFVMERMVGRFVRGFTLYLRACPTAQKLGGLQSGSWGDVQSNNLRAYLLKSFILAGSLFRMQLESEVSHISPSPILSMLKKSLFFTAYL